MEYSRDTKTAKVVLLASCRPSPRPSIIQYTARGPDTSILILSPYCLSTLDILLSLIIAITLTKSYEISYKRLLHACSLSVASRQLKRAPSPRLALCLQVELFRWQLTAPRTILPLESNHPLVVGILQTPINLRCVLLVCGAWTRINPRIYTVMEETARL